MDIKSSKLIFLLTVLFIGSVNSGVSPSSFDNENDSGVAQTVQINGNTGSIKASKQSLKVEKFTKLGGPTVMPQMPLMHYTRPKSSTNPNLARPGALFNVNRLVTNRFPMIHMPNQLVPSPPIAPLGTKRKPVHLSLDVVAGGLEMRGGSVSNLQKTHQTRPWSVSEALKFNVGRIPIKNTVSDLANNQRAIKSTTRYPIKRMKAKAPSPIVVGTSFKAKENNFKHPASEFRATGQVQTALFQTNASYHAKQETSEKYQVTTRNYSVINTITARLPTPNQASIKNKTQTISLTTVKARNYTKLSYPGPTLERKLKGNTNIPKVMSSIGSTTPSEFNANLKYSSNKPLHSFLLTSVAPADYFKEPKTTDVVEVYNHDVTTSLMKPNFLTKHDLVSYIEKPKLSAEASVIKHGFKDKPIATTILNKKRNDVRYIGTHSSDSKVDLSLFGTPLVNDSIVYDVKFVNNEFKNIKETHPQLGEVKVGPLRNNSKQVTEMDNTKPQTLNDVKEKKIIKSATNIHPVNKSTYNINFNVNNTKDKITSHTLNKIQPIHSMETVQPVNTMDKIQPVKITHKIHPVKIMNNISIKIVDTLPIKQVKTEKIKPSKNNLNKKRPIGFRTGTSKDIWSAVDTKNKNPIIGDIRSFQETALKHKGLEFSPNILDKASVKKINLNLATRTSITPTTPPPTTTTHSPDAFKVKDFSLQKWIKGDISKMVLDVSKTSSKKSEHVTKFWTPTKEYLKTLTEIEKRRRKRIMNKKTMKENLQKKQSNRISRAINTDVPINRVTTAWYEVPPLQPDVIPQFQDIPPISLDSVIGPSSGTNLGTKLSIKSSNSWNNLMTGNNNIPTWDTGPTTDAMPNSYPVENKTTASIDSIIGTHSYSENTIPPAGPNTVQNTAAWTTRSNTATNIGSKWEVKSSKSSPTWSIGPNTATKSQIQNAATAIPIVPSTDKWNQLPSSGTSVNTDTNWSGQSGSSSHWSNNAVNSAIDSASTWTTDPQSNRGTIDNSQWNHETGTNSGTNAQWNQNTGSSSAASTGSQWENTNINTGIHSSQWDQNSGTVQQSFNENLNSNKNIKQGQSHWDQNIESNTGSASTTWNQNTGSSSQWNVESNNVNQNTGTASQMNSGLNTVNTNTDSANRWNSGTNIVNQRAGTTTQWNSGSNIEIQNTASETQWNSGTNTANQNTGSSSYWNSGSNMVNNAGGGSSFQSQPNWNQQTESNKGGTSSNWNQKSETGTQWNTGSNVSGKNSGSSSGTKWTSSSSSTNFQNTGSNPPWNQNTGTGSSTSGSNWDQHSNVNSNWQQRTTTNLDTGLNSQWNNQAVSSNSNNNNVASTVQNSNSQWNNGNTASNNGQWNEIPSASFVHSANTASNGGQWNQISTSSVGSRNTISNNGKWNKMSPSSLTGTANTASNNVQWEQIKPSTQFGSSTSTNHNVMSTISKSSFGQSLNQNQQTTNNLRNANQAGESSNWNHGSNTGSTMWNNGGQWNKVKDNVQSNQSPANDNVNVIKESGLLSGGVQTISQGVVITKPEPTTPAPPPPRQNQWGLQNNWNAGGPGQGWHSAHQKGWVEIPQNNPKSVQENMNNHLIRSGTMGFPQLGGRNINNPQTGRGNINNPQTGGGNINNPQTGGGNINNPQTGGGNMRPPYNNQVPAANNWNSGANNQQPWHDNSWYQNNQQGPPRVTTTTTTTPKPTTRQPVRKKWVDRRTRWERMRERQYQMEMRRRRVYQRRLNRQLTVGDVPEGLSNVVQLNNFVNSLGGRLNPRDAAMAVMIDLT